MENESKWGATGWNSVQIDRTGAANISTRVLGGLYDGLFIKNDEIIKKDIPSEYILYSHEGMASSPIHSYYSDSYSNLFKIESENISDLKDLFLSQYFCHFSSTILKLYRSTTYEYFNSFI